MKKYLFIFLSVCFSNLVKSEGYQKMMKDGNKWNFLYELYTTCGCGGVTSTYSMTLSNDTTIGELNYKKMLCTIINANIFGTIYETTRYAAAVREDSAKQIVYIKYPAMDEQILYNFNLHVGDTLSVKNVYKDHWTDTKTIRTVKNIKQYDIGGFTGKMIVITDTVYSYYTSMHYPYKWSSIYECFSDSLYEGMGSRIGLIDLNSAGILQQENRLQLLCFWNNDNLIYHQAEHSECVYALNTGINDISEKKEIIYPNPASKKLVIDTDLKVSLIQVYNMEGKKELETKNKDIDISGLTNGIYFVKIHTESGILKVQKIIKQE